MTEASTDMPYRKIWYYIKQNSLDVIKDFYGNYIVQLILEVGLYKEISSAIISMVVSNLQILITHKVGSNVVEKCIEYCSEVGLQF